MYYICILFCLQEDLTPKDTEEILDDLQSGKKPRPGPRYYFSQQYRMLLFIILFCVEAEGSQLNH